MFPVSTSLTVTTMTQRTISTKFKSKIRSGTGQETPVTLMGTAGYGYWVAAVPLLLIREGNFDTLLKSRSRLMRYLLFTAAPSLYIMKDLLFLLNLKKALRLPMKFPNQFLAVFLKRPFQRSDSLIKFQSTVDTTQRLIIKHFRKVSGNY